MSNLKILQEVELFSDLRSIPGALEVVAGLMEQRSASTATKLIQEHVKGDELFVLVQGQVSVYKTTPDGDQYKVMIFKGDMRPALGEGGLIEAEPRSATVICDTECQFLVLGRDQFVKFSQEHPDWALPILRKIAKTLMGRLRQTSNDMMLLHKALMSEIRN